MKLLSGNLLIVSNASVEREAYKKHFLQKEAGPTLVAEAENRIQAINLLKSSEVSAVLLDCNFPNDDALSILEAILEFKPGLPIVLLVGEGDEGLLKDSMQRGASHYLIKSCINASTLLIALSVAEALARQKHQRDNELEELRMFAGVLSQCLKSPVQYIQTLSSALAKQVSPSQQPDTSASLIGQMQRECEGLVKTVDSLHQYTRVREGGAGKHLPISLSELVDTAKSYLRKVLSKANAEVSCTNDARISCKTASMVQLLQHIIENGVKFNESASPQVKIGADIHDEMLRISITDNGMGIHPEKLQLAFKPFTRLMNSLTSGGCGLGLAISQKIAQGHGGRLYCESQVGFGSTFFVELPLLEGDHLISSPSS